MGLGIRREMVGDILPGQDACDILLLREIAPLCCRIIPAPGAFR